MGLQLEVLSMGLVHEPLAVELRSCMKALQQAEVTAKMRRHEPVCCCCETCACSVVHLT